VIRRFAIEKGVNTMPRGDRTGPIGAGRRTGREAGWCAGYDRPGFANPTPRLGLQLGYRGGRRGNGRGRRKMYCATGLPGWARADFVPPAAAAGQELADLKAQAAWLAEGLDAMRKRIEEIESRGAASAAP
jgi:hypothetical protein